MPFLLDLFRIRPIRFNCSRRAASSTAVQFRRGDAYAGGRAVGTCAMTGAPLGPPAHGATCDYCLLTVALFGSARVFFGRALHNACEGQGAGKVHLLHVPAVVRGAVARVAPETGARRTSFAAAAADGRLCPGLAAVCIFQRRRRPRRVRRRPRIASPRARCPPRVRPDRPTARPIRSTPANATSSCQVSRSRRCGRAVLLCGFLPGAAAVDWPARPVRFVLGPAPPQA